jgi:hypothetical protein
MDIDCLLEGDYPIHKIVRDVYNQLISSATGSFTLGVRTYQVTAFKAKKGMLHMAYKLDSSSRRYDSVLSAVVAAISAEEGTGRKP